MRAIVDCLPQVVVAVVVDANVVCPGHMAAAMAIFLFGLSLMQNETFEKYVGWINRKATKCS